MEREDFQRIRGLPWGYLWKADVGMPFNIWKDGSLVVGGGFELTDNHSWDACRMGHDEYTAFLINPDISDEERRMATSSRRNWKWLQDMLNAVPSCALLMTDANFEWIEKNVLKPTGREYVRLSINKPVFTS